MLLPLKLSKLQLSWLWHGTVFNGSPNSIVSCLRSDGITLPELNAALLRRDGCCCCPGGGYCGVGDAGGDGRRDDGIAKRWKKANGLIT